MENIKYKKMGEIFLITKFEQQPWLKMHKSAQKSMLPLLKTN